MADDKKTDDAVKKHQLTFTQGGLNLVDSFLGQPGWTKKTKSLYKAGVMLEALEFLIDTKGKPSTPIVESDTPRDVAQKLADEFNEEVKAWASKDVEWEVTDSEYEVLKEAAKHFAEQGTLQPSKHLNRIIEQLGLIEE